MVTRPFTKAFDFAPADGWDNYKNIAALYQVRQLNRAKKVDVQMKSAILSPSDAYSFDHFWAAIKPPFISAKSMTKRTRWSLFILWWTGEEVSLRDMSNEQKKRFNR